MQTAEMVLLRNALEFEQERVRLLIDLYKAEDTDFDLRELIKLLAPRLRRVIGCDFIGVAVPDQTTSELRQELVNYPDGKGAVFEGMLVPIHGSASGKAFRTRELVRLEKSESNVPDPEIFGNAAGTRFYQQVLKEGIPSGYFLPLKDENGVFGILQLKKYTDVLLSPQEGDFLSALASQLSRSMKNALRQSQEFPQRGLAPWQMRRVITRLQNRLNGSVSVSELAAECNLSARHFARAFRFTTGLQPHRWMMNKRIERAKDLLATSALSLAEVALQCGFSDQTAFTRTFKRVCGQTPRVWQRMQKK